MIRHLPPRHFLPQTLVGFAFLASLNSPVSASSVSLEGRFLYEDRIWDPDGYTGEVQDLPIRFADIEVVDSFLSAVVATGSTDSDGAFSLVVDLSSATQLYVRCISTTHQSEVYTTGTVSQVMGTSGHIIATESQSVDPSSPSTGLFGEYLIEDLTGTGVAQAFHVLDCSIDVFDYLASPHALGRYPTPEEYVYLYWNGTVGPVGSSYNNQRINITSRSNDTDGWSDTVILHELGHWVNDLFSDASSPGGTHVIGDNFQDPRLSFGEGQATFFGAEVREFRASRLNDEGQPLDDSVSMYADLGIPPAIPGAGGLEFSYDLETGLSGSGFPLGQIGTANETSVASILWDIVDGETTTDESPGVDDDNLDGTGAWSWAPLANYLPVRGQTDPLTLDDFHDGWIAEHGEGFLRAQLDEVFTEFNTTALIEDDLEPNDELADATPLLLPSYQVSAGGGVVISEVFIGDRDQIEIFNSGEEAIDLTGWFCTAYRNSLPASTFVFPDFVLGSGDHVVLHPGGTAADNNYRHLYNEGFLIFWAPEDDGAAALRTPEGLGVDFVRWDNVNGTDPSTRNPPAGTSWTGSIFAPPRFQSLARDENGTDSDDASDFSASEFSMGMANFPSILKNTIYPEGDVDLIRLDVLVGDVISVNAFSSHSAGRPVIELLSEDGLESGAISESFDLEGLASLQFIAPSDTTLYARIGNGSAYNQYCPILLNVYERPRASGQDPPVAAFAVSANQSDLNDEVSLSWFNGGTYDVVELSRGGIPVVELPGGQTFYEENLPRGLYRYSLRGKTAGVLTEEAAAYAFAGLVDCFSEEDFESGTAGLVLGGNWGPTPFAFESATAITDSPFGNYQNNQDVSVELIEPTEMVSEPFLQFDHICLTEPEFDFGYVEVSRDLGTNWIQLAAYDGDDYPEWLDGTLDADDWQPEIVDLSGFLGEQVRVRFRLVSDALVLDDGWYIDNVRISDLSCEEASDVPAEMFRGPLQALPNPSSGSVTVRWSLENAEDGVLDVVDVKGRRVRSLFEGRLPMAAEVRWDGLDDAGRVTPAGVYWIRLRAGDTHQVVKALRVD